MKPFPLKRLEGIWHIGTLHPENKKTNSHEGAGLSVSTEPLAWKRIAKLSGYQYKVIKKENSFLDYHKMTKEQKEIIMQWGIRNGYIQTSVLYEVRYFDDEMECDMLTLFEDKEEAETEAEYHEVEIIEKMGYTSTEKMKKKVFGDANPVMIMDLLTVIYAEEELGVDGVWWQDKLDVYRYTAPKGVIVPSKIKDWTFEKVTENNKSNEKRELHVSETGL